jgi:hypothetical protein
MANPLSFAAAAVALGAAAFAARRLANASAKQDGSEVQFEDSASGELVVLGLNR